MQVAFAMNQLSVIYLVDFHHWFGIQNTQFEFHQSIKRPNDDSISVHEILLYNP